MDQAHAAVLLAPLPLRQVLEVLDVIDDVHVTTSKLRELARMHCRGEEPSLLLRQQVEWLARYDQLAEEFVRRVDAGEIRSRRTYLEMRRLLAREKADGPQA